jgi:hypothetical protein
LGIYSSCHDEDFSLLYAGLVHFAYELRPSRDAASISLPAPDADERRGIDAFLCGE